MLLLKLYLAACDTQTVCRLHVTETTVTAYCYYYFVLYTALAAAHATVRLLIDCTVTSVTSASQAHCLTN
jgi:hypothetical protein